MTVLPITQLVRNAIARLLVDAVPEALSTPEVLSPAANRPDATTHTGAPMTTRVRAGLPTARMQRGVGAQLSRRLLAHPGHSNLRALARHGSLEWAPARYPRRKARWRYIPNPDLVYAADEVPCDTEGAEVVDLPLDAQGT